MLIGALLVAGCGADRPRETRSAQAMYDDAVVAALDGDALAWREALVQLAAAWPDTPHGRAAVSQLNQSTAYTLMGMVSAFYNAFQSLLSDEPAEESPPMMPEDLDEPGGVPAAPLKETL